MRGRHGVETRVPLVGRERELAQLERLAGERACVVIVGTGGVGKSRLALEAALRWEERHGGTAAFVNLTGVGADAVAGTAVDALGLQWEAGRSLLQTLGGPQPLPAGLVVVDNCEDAASAAREVIERLHARGVAVVATSRSPLYVRNETGFELAPFDLAEGCAFFAARAKLADVDVRLDGAEGDAARSIVKRLDGLAVAIDLAAARLASLSVEELDRELTRPRPVHFRGSSVSEPRHRTLNRVVDWSLEKLDETARFAFAVAGRFAATFDAGDVGALVPQASGEVERVLEELAEQSLLVRVATPHAYRMLAPIRAVAKRRLELLLERRKIEERFALHVAALASQLKARIADAVGAGALRDIAERYDDLLSALEWALGDPRERLARVLPVVSVLGELWTDGGRSAEGARWCARAIEAGGTLDPLDRARLHYLALRIAYVACDYDRMLELGPQLVSAFTMGGDRLGLARAYNGLAVASMHSGRFEEASTYAGTALALYRSLHHDAGIASALINQGSIALEGSRDAATARRRYLEALPIAQRAQREATLALAYGNLAEAAYGLADAAQAEEYALQALERFERTGDRPRVCWALQSLARAHLLRYRNAPDPALLASAASAADRGLAVAEREYHPDYLALALETSSRIVAGSGDVLSAAFLASAAQRVRRERRVPAFGYTLDDAVAALAHLERELEPAAYAAAAQRAQTEPLEAFAGLARAALAAVRERPARSPAP
ncbi:MAG TPA: tetratricopeptide repeat protein [Candidatus Acidoferrales bacterium]|nr:tetratricopeptide repeat protein [Candidatus Acidoferrales bacterium]